MADRIFYAVDVFYSIVFLLAFIADTWMLGLICRRKFAIFSSYVAFHSRYGLMRTGLLKLVIVLLLIYDLLGYSIKSGAIMSIITGYLFFVVKMLVEYRGITKES